jgi:CMP-N,N'-diacetyllegionaminic acid synthase
LIAAVIPARGGSKGIKDKNLIDLCGKPLLAWSIEQATACPQIDQVFVTSDSERILDVARRHGAKGIVRPAELATDTASSDDALLHALDEIEQRHEDVELMVFLQATSPLRKPSDITAAIDTVRTENADSLFSSVRMDDVCLWRAAAGRPIDSVTYDYRNRGRRQDRQPYLLENGSIYVFKPDVLRREHNRLGGRIAVSTMEPWQAFEIDSLEDLPLCEYYMQRHLLAPR